MKYLLPLALGLMLLAAACGQQPVASEAPPTAQDSIPDTPEAQVRALSLQIGRSPRDYSLYERRSQAYYELDSLPQSLADIETALGLYPNGPELHYWRGFLAFVQQDTARAKEAYHTAIGLGTQQPEVYYQLGQLYFFQSQYDRALDMYRQAAKMRPDDPQYVFAQGFLEHSRRRHSEAAARYLDALAIDSTFDKALLQLHDLYREAYQNDDEAMKYNARLLQADPLHPLANFNAGSYHLRRALAIRSSDRMDLLKDEVNEATTHFTLATNRDPDFAMAWYNLGYCFWLGDDVRAGDAFRCFGRVVALDSTYAPAWFMLGSIHEKNGDLESALASYRRAVAHQPGSADFRQAVAEVEAQLKGK
ncbi:MAG: hypothetical protein OHK0039_33450 [Bacteroidia bacterium]